MDISLSDLIVWLVIGVLAGALTGMVVTAGQGMGRWTSLGVGLVGALIGGALFRLFNIASGLDSISISLRDVLAAFVGSLIFLAVLWVLRMRKES